MNESHQLTWRRPNGDGFALYLNGGLSRCKGFA
jgi:hypothetical protein